MFKPRLAPREIELETIEIARQSVGRMRPARDKHMFDHATTGKPVCPECAQATPELTTGRRWSLFRGGIEICSICQKAVVNGNEIDGD